MLNIFEHDLFVNNLQIFDITIDKNGGGGGIILRQFDHCLFLWRII